MCKEQQSYTESPNGLIDVRYHAALKYIPSAVDKGSTILDVGGSLLSKRVIKYLRPDLEVHTLNIQKEYHNNPDRCGEITYNGTDIPIASNSVSYVIAIDTFEHVIPQQRFLLSREMFRVAIKGIIISCPFHCRKNVKQEQKLMKKMCVMGIQLKRSLAEHKKMGLPRKSDLTMMAEKLKPTSWNIFPETPREQNLRFLQMQLNVQPNDRSWLIDNFNYTMRHYPNPTWNKAYRAVLVVNK